MFGILDILALIAFVSTIAGTAVAKQPSGPEGPIGAWLLLVIPCLFVAILVVVLVAKEPLDFGRGGRLIQFVIAVGIPITFSTAIFEALDRHNSVIQGLLIALPYLILACCAAIIHHSNWSNLRLVHWTAALLLGGAGLAGWGLAGKAILLSLQRGLEQVSRQEQKEKRLEERYEQEEADKYAELEVSPPLQALLRFTWSRNGRVRRQARAQASGYPGLDDKLIELLDRDNEDAVSYIANVYENPPARLAPAWGRMLERKLAVWDTLRFDKHAGTWEQNLVAYFVGAQKIRLAGGLLGTQLLSWHKHLQKCKGLGKLADFVGDSLQTKSKS